MQQITCFDKKKSIWKESNSTKVSCEYYSSIFSFSGLRSHIKKCHKDMDLPKSIHSDTEIKEEPEYYKYYLIVSKLKAIGVDIDKLLEE